GAPGGGGRRSVRAALLCMGLGRAGGGRPGPPPAGAAVLLVVRGGLGPAEAGPGEPMAVAYRGVVLGRPEPGRTAAVLGAGPIGIGCLLALRAQGIEDVVVSEPAPGRRAIAAALGAAIVLDPAATDVVAAVPEHPPGAR